MRDLEQLVRRTVAAHKLFGPCERVVVGVSGGPDSLALLHVLHSLRDELQIELTAAHLNHGLRGAESEADAAFVEATAREWGIPAAIGAVDVAAHARESRLSIEEAGRVARYAFLASVAGQAGAGTIAVGHTTDDQVETVLMHFIRGSGLAGLRGMQYKSSSPLTGQPGELREGEPVPAAFPELTLVRPLLDATRVDIEGYCRQQGLAPRSDTSNQDETFFRNRLRHQVIPYLKGLNPNLAQVLFRNALSISDDYDYLRAHIQYAFSSVARAEQGAFVFLREPWRALPPSLQRGVLREAIRLLRPGARNINWEHVEQARRVALDGETGARATLPLALDLHISYGEFSIAPVGHLTTEWPRLSSDRAALRVPGETVLPGSAWTILVEQTAPGPLAVQPPGGAWEAWLDLDKIVGALYLRRRMPGDRFQPSGMEGHKSLHDFMIDAKIPQALRDGLPLLCDAEKILWVCGWRLDEQARMTSETKRALRVKFIPHLYRDHELAPALPGES